MKKTPVTLEDLQGVFPVPPLARKFDARRTIDYAQNEEIVRHLAGGGMRRFLYGGNAFLYHVTLTEYEALIDWLSGFPGDLWAIPSLGPSYGRAIDQAALLRRHKFPCAMVLPCNDPRDAAGLERGLREIAEAAGIPLVLYLKEENNFGADKEAGLDVVARLVNDGSCVWIKYAVIRENPAQDAYLESLLKRVDRRRVVSGIGERPAVVHLRDWKLPGFTTGSGCIAPRLSRAIFEACAAGDFEEAEKLREEFLPLEDLRDAWGPSKVLHYATDLADIADTGPVPPFLSLLPEERMQQLKPVAIKLLEQNTTRLLGS
ncbi:MAG: dihydrodipicolinate synthase family protein [Blastocatellia bacterium]|nr:dihydrodipicolinate synthase family protein [Blastocatellia bacterium]